MPRFISLIRFLILYVAILNPASAKPRPKPIADYSKIWSSGTAQQIEMALKAGADVNINAVDKNNISVRKYAENRSRILTAIIQAGARP